MSNAGSQAKSRQQAAQAAREPRWIAWSTGLVGLLIAAAYGVLLSLDQLRGLRLPGCGPGSGCDQATSSVWARVPGVDWPVSYLGLAYFAAWLVAWLLRPGHVGAGPVLRWVIRLGVAGSVMFIIVMATGGYMCSYCLGVHVGNVIFWMAVEAARMRRPAGAPTWAALAATFAAATVGLGVADWRQRAALERENIAAGDELISAMTAEASPDDGQASLATQPAVIADPAAREASQQQTAAVGNADQPPADDDPQGFTGRYRLGPREAVIRLVIFSDYACQGCRMLEMEAEQILEKYPDRVSLSAKQFPLHPLCNPYTGGKKHANACAAARAAEAAGIVAGNDGFWKMHFWLFQRSGQFQPDQLHRAVAGFGWDVAAFQAAFTSDEVGDRLTADIEEAMSLGLRATPMVFVNGRHFPGWSTPGNLTRVCDAVIAAGKEPAGPENDDPIPPEVRWVAEWSQRRPVPISRRDGLYPIGDDTGRLQIIVWGDYQETNTGRADRVIRDFLETHADVTYTFRHFPFNRDCNPHVPEDRHAWACLAARAAEAAGRIGGSEAFWQAHTWLLDHRETLGPGLVDEVAAAAGLDPAELREVMASQEVADAIVADATLAQERLRIRSIPLIVVNNRVIGRWLAGPDVLLDDMLEMIHERLSGSSGEGTRPE